MRLVAGLVSSARRKKLRDKLVEEQGGKCFYCAKPFNQTNPATFEHIIPKSKGGYDTKTNAVASCNACNNERGTANHSAFLRYKQKSRVDYEQTTI